MGQVFTEFVPVIPIDQRILSKFVRLFFLQGIFIIIFFILNFKVYEFGRIVIYEVFVYMAELMAKDESKVVETFQGQMSINLDYVDALKRGELASPIALLDKINDNKNTLERVIWIAGIISALCITFTFKAYSDLNAFKDGYEKRGKELPIEQEIKQHSDKYLTDSISLQRIDSLITVKINQQDANE